MDSFNFVSNANTSELLAMINSGDQGSRQLAYNIIENNYKYFSKQNLRLLLRGSNTFLLYKLLNQQRVDKLHFKADFKKLKK